VNIDLSGKRAVISGSTAGIGYAIACGLAGAGAHVILNGRTESRVDEALRRLRAEVANASAEGVAADLGTREGTEAVMAKAPAADILVNNLGIFEPKPFLDIPDEDWERFFRINVLSGVRLARLYLPGMMERGWGRIVFMSSESGV
jgi:NAD(P)-dependent dehydrogenase (short-subunit alcohol dehydrogenase family)